MRKYLLTLIIFPLFCGALYGFSLTDWKDSLDTSIRDQAEKSFSDLFKKKVTIKEAGGIVVGQIILKDVTIEDLGEVEKVVLTFNPVQYAIDKGDIIPSLIKISVINGKLAIIRNRSGRWNIDALLPKPNDKNSAPPPFSGQIVLDNCQVTYHDQFGFKGGPEDFRTVAQAVNGKVDLGNKARITFSVGANVPQSVKAAGYFNSKNGRYELTVSAQKLPLLKWGSYTVPLPGLAPQGGTVDLALRITQPKIKGWAASLSGKVFFYNSSAKFNDYELTNVYGKLFLADESLAFQGISGRLNGLPATVNGRFIDYAKLDLRIAVNNAKLENLSSLIPALEKVKGDFKAALAVSGTVADPKLTGSLNVVKGEAYQQPFSGQAAISYADKVFRANLQNVLYHRGQVSGPATITLNDAPRLDLKLAINSLDLSALSQKTPGIEGLASGQLVLAGPFPQLKGLLTAKLNRASVFGQPMQSLNAEFQIKDGDFILDRLAGNAEQSSFIANGRINKELVFDLQAEANGLQLSGRGIFGPMKASLNHFKGRIGWKLTPAFLASPLRNMTAVGEAKLSNGQIGEQSFDRAEGLIEFVYGRIKVKNTVLQKGTSQLNLAGRTGIGTETSFAVWTNGSYLEDYPLVNYLLPDEAKNPAGRFTASFEVSGYLPPETKITSLDKLLDLNYEGRIALTNGKLAQAPVSRGAAKIAWRDRTLYISDCRLEGPQLRFSLGLELVPGSKLKATIEGVTNLESLRELTDRYGRLTGDLGATVKLEGKPDNPTVAATFWADQLEFNDLFFDRIEGSWYYANNKLQTLAPVNFRRGQTTLTLKGSADLDPNKPDASYLDFDLETEKANVGTVYQIIEGIRSEAFRWGIGAEKKTTPHLFSLTGLSYSAQKTQTEKTVWYSSDPKKPNFLGKWGMIRQEFEKKAAASPTESLSGEMDGSLSIQGKLGSPSGSLQAQVRKGGFSGFLFDSFFFSASLNGGRVAVEKAIMAKDRGSLNATGEFNLAGNLNLELKAREMPLDIIGVIFPGKDFKGTFALDSTIGGSINSPLVSLAARGKDNTVAGARFDAWTTEINYETGRLTIGQLQLQTGKELSTIEGEVAFAEPTKLNLRLNLNDGGLGIINLFNDQVSWVRGKAGLVLQAGGDLNQPRLNGRIFLADAEVKLNSLTSSLKSLNGQAQITNSLVSIEGLTALWTGERTRDYLNPVGLAGYIDLSQALGDQPSVTLNLAISPTSIFAAFPNLYIGSLQVSQLSLYGPLAFDLSAGPTLSGKVNIDNSVITLSKSGGDNNKQVPFQFDLEVNLNKNVYVVMGDIGTLDLSNIFMNLEIESKGLKISGNMRTPTLLGKVQVKRGTVNLLSREFTLLTLDQQQKYFPNSEQLGDNAATFTGEKGTEGYLPQISITSLVNVEDQEYDASGALKKKKVIIIAKLNGLIGARDEARGLKIGLSSFVEDKSKTPVEMIPANYNESDLKVLLLPDFIKSLAGIRTGGKQGAEGSSVDTNLVVADFVSSRIQTILFRGVEREVEQKLGLESLTLEYNLGPKVKEAMGVKDPVGLQEDKPAWSVGFVKGFFDRLFIDVRYAQINEQPVSNAAQNSFNYQLTFKINPIWSIIYYREPLNLNEPATGYQKVTLKAGFYLW